MWSQWLAVTVTAGVAVLQIHFELILINQLEPCVRKFFLNCCFRVILSTDEGDYPENLQIVCLCHNKLAFFGIIYVFVSFRTCLSETASNSFVFHLELDL